MMHGEEGMESPMVAKARNTPEVTGEVGEFLRLISDEQNKHRELLAILKERLGPILVEPRPEPGPDGDGPGFEGESAVAKALEEIWRGYLSHNRVVQSTIERVAV